MTAIHALITYANTQPNGSVNQRIIQILLTNLEDACELSIEQMTERCFTSPTALTRLARALGYKGYADFRTQLEQAVHNYEFYSLLMPKQPSSTQELLQSYQGTASELLEQFSGMYNADAYETICDTMHAADKILIFFGRLQSGPSIALQVELAMDGKTCLRATTIEAELQMLSELTDQSLVILRPDSLNTGRNVLSRLVDGIKSHGAKLLVIGSKSDFVIRNSADFFCEFPRTGTIMDTFAQDTVLTLLTVTYRMRFRNKQEPLKK